MKFKVELKTSNYDKMEFTFRSPKSALNFMQSATENFDNRDDGDRILTATLNLDMSSKDLDMSSKDKEGEEKEEVK